MAEAAKQMSKDDAIDRIGISRTRSGICMFITWDGKRQRARPLAARPARDEGRIYFLNDVHGAKDEQIERFPIVTLAFADTHRHDYVVITGKATVSNDRAKIKDIWTSPDKAWWDSADDPAIRLITVEPGDAELWEGPNRVVAAAGLVAAAVTGAKMDFGENRKVDHI